MGLKIGVFIYNVPVIDCKALIDSDELEFNFAAFIGIPKECNPKDLIKSLNNQGADFIFFNMEDYSNLSQLKYDNYEIPVFLLETFTDQDFFNFSDKTASRFITIKFLSNE